MNDHRLAAIALLIRKFGARIPGGGYEVTVTADEMRTMLPGTGVFQEAPGENATSVRWQYFPNHTIEGEVITPENITVSGTPSE